MTPAAATPTTRSDTMGAMLAVGTVVDGRYEIEDLLGQGGFSVVYKARHVHMNRSVALKVLSSAGIERGGHERFLQEARSIAAIDHPNIVRIHDCQSADEGLTYLAAQMLDGWDLDDEIESLGPMSARRALTLLIPCLDGLAAAHAAGIVHKDIKPSNLFVHRPENGYERLVMLDFGAASELHSDVARLTNKLELVGTVQYLAPEYIDRQLVTPAMDVYQMGLILVEMLTGRRAVEAEHPFQALNMHCRGALDVPAALRRGPLGPVLEKALALDPEDRYADAAALRDALATLDLEAPRVRNPEETARYVCVPREMPTLRMSSEAGADAGDEPVCEDPVDPVTQEDGAGAPGPELVRLAAAPAEPQEAPDTLAALAARGEAVTAHTPRRSRWRRFLAVAAWVLGVAGLVYGGWVASTWYPDMKASMNSALGGSGQTVAVLWAPGQAAEMTVRAGVERARQK